MIRNFFSTPNIIGRLLIVLLFVGGIIYAGAFNGFIVETQASCSCGGGDAPSVLSNSCPTGANGCGHPNNCAECPPKGSGGFCSGNNSCSAAD